MLSKDQLLAAIIKECEIAKHLYTKIPVGGLDYRPTAGQRSTLELLRYLTYCVAGAAHSMNDGNWNWYEKASEASKAMPAERFCAAMDAEIAELKTVFAGITSADFANKQATLPGGGTGPLCVALMETAHKWIVGYRMQLFLYCKAAGNSSIGTPNNWRGMDRKPE